MKYKKLLQATQKVYLLFAMITFIFIAPLFYFAIKQLYINEIDEGLLNHKANFIKKHQPTFQPADIALWNKYNENSELTRLQTSVLPADSFLYNNYYQLLEGENEPYRELRSSVMLGGEPYLFSAKANLVESEDLMFNIALLFLGLIALLFVGLFFITKKMSLRLWNPFYDTVRQIKQFEVDKNAPILFMDTKIEEFKRLNTSIEGLVKKNRAIYKNQREFVENAAHELQTPISIFKAKIDAFVQRADITEGQAEILEVLGDNISRLARLNKNLLLLSKMDNDQFGAFAPFSLRTLLDNQLAFFEEQGEQQNISIFSDLLTDFSLTGNKALVEILCSNLLLNAIRHNVKNGKILIELSENQLIIANTGQNVLLEEATLFNRFSKTATAKGNGLGLAIVKKIADLHQWKISYAYEDELHVFKLKVNN